MIGHGDGPWMRDLIRAGFARLSPPPLTCPSAFSPAAFTKTHDTDGAPETSAKGGDADNQDNGERVAKVLARAGLCRAARPRSGSSPAASPSTARC